MRAILVGHFFCWKNIITADKNLRKLFPVLICYFLPRESFRFLRASRQNIQYNSHYLNEVLSCNNLYEKIETFCGKL